MAQTVLIAMSGGVDSSAAALLLKEQGYDVVAAHMKLWDYAEVGGDTHRDGRCCSLESINDCRHVCDALDIPFYVLDLSTQFSAIVIEGFVSEYKAGRTPNPCIRCNTEIKWNSLLRKARELDCDHIATGHYAFVDRGGNGRYRIRKGVDHTRDQSYVLWGLTQEALSQTLLPLGGLRKSDIRKIAQDHNLRTADQKESREICFIADDDYRRFLREWEAKRGQAPQGGDILHEDGRILGHHNGTVFFTIGQRRGLGISHPTPLYVLRVDVSKNQVIVGPDESLLQTEFTVKQTNWVAIERPVAPFEADVKIRYLHPPAPATITPSTDLSVRVTFEKEQRAITAGQSAVFYDGDVVLGGGIIG